MNWLLKNVSELIHHWQIGSSEKIASVSYNGRLHSFRIDADTRRLFFLEDTGVFIKRRLIKSEYGIVLAENFSKNNNSGYLFMDKQKIFYSMKNNRIAIYSGNNKLAKASIDKYKEIDDYEVSALSFSFLWLYKTGLLKPLEELEVVM